MNAVMPVRINSLQKIVQHGTVQISALQIRRIGVDLAAVIERTEPSDQYLTPK